MKSPVPNSDTIFIGGPERIRRIHEIYKYIEKFDHWIDMEKGNRELYNRIIMMKQKHADQIK